MRPWSGRFAAAADANASLMSASDVARAVRWGCVPNAARWAARPSSAPTRRKSSRASSLVSGATVGRCFVVTMKSDYVRHGDVDPTQLFNITDVTEEIDIRMDVTRQQARDAINYLDTIPVASLLDYCKANRLDCKFIRMHFPDLPEYTIFDISYLKTEKRRELLSQNIVAIIDVPDDFPLSDKQRRQVAAAKSGETVIERDEIQKRMDAWQYPLHFLDYETFSYAIPQFEGIRPFQQMCFQYSLHTIDHPGGTRRSPPKPGRFWIPREPAVVPATPTRRNRKLGGSSTAWTGSGGAPRPTVVCVTHHPKPSWEFLK